jgi:hypothetical protein
MIITVIRKEEDPLERKNLERIYTSVLLRGKEK